jgi:hypothetical protein
VATDVRMAANAMGKRFIWSSGAAIREALAVTEIAGRGGAEQLESA